MGRGSTRGVARGAAILLALGAAACEAEPPPATVEGWRELTKSEVKAASAERLADDPETPPLKTAVRGDFNGDGRSDRVAFLVTDDGRRFAPYFFDGAGASPFELTGGDAFGRLWRYNLAVTPPGLAYGSCIETKDEAECQDEKRLIGPTIVFFEVNRGGTVIAWNGTRFEERPI